MKENKKLYVLFGADGKTLNICYAENEGSARTMLQVQPGLSVRQVTLSEWQELFQRDIMPACS